MMSFFERYFALTPEGATGMRKAILSVICNNLTTILTFAVIVCFAKDGVALLQGGEVSFVTYAWMIPLLIVARVIGERIQYDSVYTSTYKESSKIRITLAEKMARLPLSFFEKKDAADLSRRILVNVEKLEHAYSHAVPQFFGGIITTALLFVMVLIFQWRMALAIFWPIPITLFFIFLFKRKKADREAQSYETSTRVSSKMQELIENYLPIRTYGRTAHSLIELRALLMEAERSQMKAELMNPVILAPIQTLYRLGMATIILVGFGEYAAGRLDLELLIQFLLASSVLYVPIEATATHIMEFLYLGAPVKSIGEITQMKSMVGGKQAPKDMSYALQNVSFSYDGTTPVLKGISTTIRQGEVTALVGASGCGKSTLAKLLLRFYDPTHGSISLGGNDLATWDPQDLLSHCSMVFQDVIVFNNTIKENIRLGKAGATDDEVYEVARIAQVDEFVQQLPQGYDTVIGEGGRLLSGGERQRISIARALLKDAPIIFLDESTASVDADSETKIQNALATLIKDKTVIVIAHRLRTVMNANKIIVFDKGRIVEEGRAQDLLAHDGFFKRLVESQG